MSVTDIDLLSMDDDQLSLSLFLSDLAIPWNLDNDNVPFEFLDDTNHSYTLADGQPENALEGIEGLDQAQAQLFSANSSNAIDYLPALLKNNLTDNNPQLTDVNQSKSFVVKSSDINNTTNFINSVGFIQTGQLLNLTVSPFPYQRARYEQELQKTLRYVCVLNNDSITLEVSDFPDLRHKFGSEVSLWMRITRTTKPNDNNNLILCHPYPIWLNNKDAKVQNGSLFIPITDQITKKITEFPIYTSTQLNFNEFYSTNTSTPKRTRDKYDLRYSILHFQIFLIDQNNTAYPTDLECQTEPIYEYEGKELNSLPPMIHHVRKLSIKRKQIGQRKKSKAIYKKKMSTQKLMMLDGPHPHGEFE